MLQGISPLLSGELLKQLDATGHSDAVVIVDAHFPAARLATRLIELPGTSVTDVLAAVRTVLPLDDDAPLALMATPGGDILPIHTELARIAGADPEYVERRAFYALAADAFVIVGTGEQRTYANALVRKGIVR